SCAEVVLTGIAGDTRAFSPGLMESAMKAELGELPETPLAVVQSLSVPVISVVLQPGGNIGAVTSSKFSLKLITVKSCPRGILKLTLPRLLAPSCSCKVAVIVPPQAPVAVKVNCALAAAPGDKAP